MTEKYRLTRAEALERYGSGFVKSFMKDGLPAIDLTAAQRVGLEEWRIVRNKLVYPFRYDYVYVVADGQGHYKVGNSIAPTKRLSSMQTGSSISLTFIGALICQPNTARNIERAAHTWLKKGGYHWRGEWFTGSEVDAIAGLNLFALARFSGDVVDVTPKLTHSNERLLSMWTAINGEESLIDIKKWRQEYYAVREANEKAALTFRQEIAS